MKKVFLEDWTLRGYHPHVPLIWKSVETGGWFLPIHEPVKAKVPGSVFKDLINAGIIPDPYFDMNSQSCEWVSERWWQYTTFFEAEDGVAELVFEGIDTNSIIYLNETKLGETDNMFVPAVFDVTDKIVKGKPNRVDVIICGVPENMGQIGYTSKADALKCRFTYKWDFSTRLINLGIYRPAYVRFIDTAKINDCRFNAKSPASLGKAGLSVAVKGYHAGDVKIKVEMTGPDGKKEFEGEKSLKVKAGRSRDVKFDIKVSDVKLWNINGWGEQALYGLKVSLFKGDKQLDSWEQNVGFRDFELVPNEDAPKGSLPYTPLVNGRRHYIKGVNFVPMDIMYGGIPKEKYEQFFKLIAAANVNLIRVWGGGLIEDEVFYDLADKYGIMVWQEFPQSSSAIENVPCKSKKFLKGLKAAAIHAIKEKRNHASMCIWCGGNELRDFNEIPVDFTDINIKMLLKEVKRLSPRTPMLPSSASGPNEMRIPGQGRDVNHDVHGVWVYSGVKEHYDFYNNSDCMLHSEFGVEGMSGLEAIRKFLSPEYIGVFDKQHPVWRHHGEWWISTERDREIFGEIGSIEDLITVSQFIQGEGLRYAVEANRRRFPYNSGSIIWQANEPYPNVSCTSLLDYYNNPKPSLKEVGNAFAPLNVNLKYEKLLWKGGETLRLGVFAIYDYQPLKTLCLVKVLHEGKVIAKAQCETVLGDGMPVELSDLSRQLEVTVPREGALVIELQAENEAHTYFNAVLLLIEKENGKADIECVKQFMARYKS